MTLEILLFVLSKLEKRRIDYEFSGKRADLIHISKMSLCYFITEPDKLKTL